MTFLKKFSFLLLISLLVFSSCKKDQIIETEDTIVLPSPEVIVDGSLTGVVVDKNGLALQNTKIQVGTHSIDTDENGVFLFKNIKLDEKGALITAEKDGYFYNAKFIRPNLNKMAFTKIMLIEKALSGTFDAASGGAISMNGNAKVEIPAGGVKLEGGGSYSGNVNVYATWLDPTGDDLLLEMPGDLRGMNTNEEQVQLLTYGMIGVELEGDAGEALNIADDKTATIELPVPTELLGSAPSTIPLWHFDEASGYWVEDGEAVLQDGKYVGTVSHFSFWNCDDPNFFIDLTGMVTDANGNPIQSLQVEVENTSDGTVGYGWTNEEGIFNGFVPKDEVLIIRIYDHCGVEIHSETIGAFSDNTTINPIAVTNNNNSFTLSGSLIDCPGGNPVLNGYVKVEIEDGFYHILPLDNNGSFSNTINICNATSIQVTGYDLNTPAQSEATIYDITGLNELDLEEISTCEELAEFFNFNLNGTTYALTELLYLDNSSLSDFLIYAGGADSTTITFNFPPNPLTNTTYNPAFLNIGSYAFGASDVGIASCAGCTELSLIFQTFDQTPGTGLIEGTLDGEVTEVATGMLVPLTASFKIISD